MINAHSSILSIDIQTYNDINNCMHFAIFVVNVAIFSMMFFINLAISIICELFYADIPVTILIRLAI